MSLPKEVDPPSLVAKVRLQSVMSAASDDSCLELPQCCHCGECATGVWAAVSREERSLWCIDRCTGAQMHRACRRRAAERARFLEERAAYQQAKAVLYPRPSRVSSLKPVPSETQLETTPSFNRGPMQLDTLGAVTDNVQVQPLGASGSCGDPSVQPVEAAEAHSSLPLPLPPPAGLTATSPSACAAASVRPHPPNASSDSAQQSQQQQAEMQQQLRGVSAKPPLKRVKFQEQPSAKGLVPVSPALAAPIIPVAPAAAPALPCLLPKALLQSSGSGGSGDTRLMCHSSNGRLERNSSRDSSGSSLGSGRLDRMSSGGQLQHSSSNVSLNSNSSGDSSSGGSSHSWLFTAKPVSIYTGKSSRSQDCERRERERLARRSGSGLRRSSSSPASPHTPAWQAPAMASVLC